jgi:hypothetical protein
MAGAVIFLSPKERLAIKVAGVALERVRGSSAAAPFRARLGPRGDERLKFAADGLRDLRTKFVRMGRLDRSTSK